jgi:hypothetical protein
MLLDGSGVRAHRTCQQGRSEDDGSFHGILRFVCRPPAHGSVGDETQEVQDIIAP